MYSNEVPQPSAPPQHAAPQHNLAPGRHPARGDCAAGDALLFLPSSEFEYEPRCLPGAEVRFVEEDHTHAQPCRVTFPTGVTCWVHYDDLHVLGAAAECAAGWDPCCIGAGIAADGARLVKESAAPYEHAVALGQPAAAPNGVRVQWRCILGEGSERSMVGFAREGTPVKGIGCAMAHDHVYAIDTSDGSLYAKGRGHIGEAFFGRALPPGTALTLAADPATGTISAGVDGEEPRAVWRGVQASFPLRPFIELCAKGATVSMA